jgi:hypothetical protein
LRCWKRWGACLCLFLRSQFHVKISNQPLFWIWLWLKPFFIISISVLDCYNLNFSFRLL